MVSYGGGGFCTWENRGSVFNGIGEGLTLYLSRIGDFDTFSKRLFSILVRQLVNIWRAR